MQGRATEHVQDSTAGIDVSKAFLDLAVEGREEVLRFRNDPAGIARLVAALGGHHVHRVGLEATAGYERPVYDALLEAGFETVLLQPIEVKAFAVATRRRAKTDALDARLIAACVRHIGRAGTRFSALHLRLAEQMLLVEQIEEDLACAKTRLEHYSQPETRRKAGAVVTQLTLRLKRELAHLTKALRSDERLARRLELVGSVPGLGERTALTMVVRLPELGTLSREEIAALVGVAPFDVQSGRHKGAARIKGGRSRVRKALFAAALPAAFRWNPALIALYRRLIDKGRAHKQALIACVRKLLIYANTVVQRGTPWVPDTVSG
jgi:transposase